MKLSASTKLLFLTGICILVSLIFVKSSNPPPISTRELDQVISYTKLNGGWHLQIAISNNGNIVVHKISSPVTGGGQVIHANVQNDAELKGLGSMNTKFLRHLIPVMKKNNIFLLQKSNGMYMLYREKAAVFDKPSLYVFTPQRSKKNPLNETNGLIAQSGPFLELNEHWFFSRNPAYGQSRLATEPDVWD